MEKMPNLNGITSVPSDDYYSIRNNYRFDALLRAIDFFSQKFNMETLIDFSGDFINEILTLGPSAVFIYNRNEDCFVARKIRLYKTDLLKTPNTLNMQSIATLYGTTIFHNFDKFFTSEFIDIYKPALLIPLIHANTLLGFIITSGKAVGELSEDDFRMAKAIMYLFNTAFERHYYMDEISNTDAKLNNKVFETVSKASRLLFSEISLPNLPKAGIEIFSEISGSLNTSFGVLDGEKNAIKIDAYSDVRKKGVYMGDDYLYFIENPVYENDKYLYSLTDEFANLKNIFKNPEKFTDYNTKYVVLIVKEKILGFVTLGSDVKNGAGYSKETLELINSLAISCFIALQNAMLFERISVQKADIEVKYSALLKLMR